MARDVKLRHALSNSFGFGGQNVSLVIGRAV
jgi:3-oxoacyl-(acyl-carrier-protein) synthase